MARRWFCAKSSLSHWGLLDRRHSILMLKPLFRREASEESPVREGDWEVRTAAKLEG
jgi:hypothetical protein